MKKGIIFDMDGTLWDSAANVAESWNLAIKQDGTVDKKLTEQDIQGVMGKTMDVIADILFPELEKEVRMKLLDRCCSQKHMGLEQLQRTCRKSIHLRNLQRQQTNILLCGKKL